MKNEWRGVCSGAHLFNANNPQIASNAVHTVIIRMVVMPSDVSLVTDPITAYPALKYLDDMHPPAKPMSIKRVMKQRILVNVFIR